MRAKLLYCLVLIFFMFLTPVHAEISEEEQEELVKNMREGNVESLNQEYSYGALDVRDALAEFIGAIWEFPRTRNPKKVYDSFNNFHKTLEGHTDKWSGAAETFRKDLTEEAFKLLDAAFGESTCYFDTGSMEGCRSTTTTTTTSTTSTSSSTSSTTSTTIPPPPPPPTPPGGDHPDETIAIGSFATTYSTNATERDWAVFVSRLYERTPEYDTLLVTAEKERLEFAEIYNTSKEKMAANETISNETMLEYFKELSEAVDLLGMVVDSWDNAFDIAILEHGFYPDSESFLEKGLGGYPVTIKPGELDTVGYQKVLVIPSGGLYGMDSSQMFKAKLEKYVLEGGTLIVFSQQRGYEFQALPGGNLTGYGWLEDQSCFARAVYIDTYHPILSGQDSVTLDLNVDGYFTSWPENSTILFTRTKNGMPAGIMYKYGNGTVIATTAYTDWAYTHGQRTGDGLALVRDILAWAVANAEDMEIPEYGHGDTVNISVPITNNGNSTAASVIFNVIDPDKNIVGNVSVPVVIVTGETRTVDASYAVQSKAGIWTVDYELVNDSNDTVQVDYDVVRFAVGGNFSRDFSKRLYNIGNISENGGC